jgi:hypothetical protein
VEKKFAGRQKHRNADASDKAVATRAYFFACVPYRGKFGVALENLDSIDVFYMHDFFAR